METPRSFQILKIAAYSDLPLRNSVDKLVFGHHMLWENDNVTDGDKGSLEPNAFGYDFVSPVASNALLYVTMKPIDGGLVGKEYRLSGNLDSDTTKSNIFESDFFSIECLDAITIKARVVQPNTSGQPFSWTGNFTWVIEQKLTSGKVTCAHPTATCLELYWISNNINAIFLTGHSGIPVELLRTAITKLTATNLGTLNVRENPKKAAEVSFYDYSKVYDTVAGAAHFGVGPFGGTFWYDSYVKAASGGNAGSLQPIVNCYDQAAMVQVVQQMGPTERPTWLYQAPYGYILETNLVGIGQCNNPFFNRTTPPGPKIIDGDDPARTRFGNHAFNGIPGATPSSDSIYDACAGPHLGDPTEDYEDLAIDRDTELSTAENTGDVEDIKLCTGVDPVEVITRTTLTTRPSKGVEDLIQKSVARNPNSRLFSQLHWGNVPYWIKSVLGEKCDVAFHEFHIESAAVEVVWYLTGVDHGGEDDTLVLDVRTSTSIDSGGNLDLTKSHSMAIDDLRYELKNTEMELGPNDEVLDTLWVPAPFGEYTQHAIQYAPGTSRGRMLIGSGNCMINLYGGSSSSSLEPIVNKILSHTTFRGAFPVHIPNVTEHRFNIPQVFRGYARNVVQGIGSSFEVHCDLPQSIAAATAHVLDYGLLLKDYTIDNAASEGISTVTFTFVTRKIGIHDVDLRFASAPALTSSTKRIQVEVTEA